MTESKHIRDAQRVLRVWGGYSGEIDGDPGPLSLGAAARVPHVTRHGWPAGRRVIAAAQAALEQQGQAPGPHDGLWGPQTAAAYMIWRRRYYTPTPYRRPDADWQRPGAGEGTGWGTEATLDARFGKPGNPRCTAGRVAFLWPAVLAWDASVEIEDFACHEDVAPSLARVFERIADTHRPAEIEALGLHLFGGCYNLRRKRGGASWSTHAYGVACDWDPARNALDWGADRARLAQPDADRVWAAWSAEGWCSLGQTADFDWMHVQAPGR